MSEEPESKLRPYAKAAIGFGALLLLPAVWSFCSAVVSAARTGQVMVVSVGRYETAREMVHWSLGWSRFIAPLLLLSALFLWGASKQYKPLWWVSAALAATGCFMLAFSLWFASWSGVIWFWSLVAFIALALYVGNRIGRWAVVVLVASAFIIGWSASNAA